MARAGGGWGALRLRDLEEVRHLGRGSYGRVALVRPRGAGPWPARAPGDHQEEARDLALGREPLVLKSVPLAGLKPADREAALNEVVLMRSFRHANLCRYEWAWEEEGALHILMEHCAGGDLAQLLARGVPLDEDQIWEIVIGLAEGLRYLHEHRVLHRDLKPSNIFLDVAGRRAVIGDLGFARELYHNRLATTAVGTPVYLSPEQCEGKPYGAKSDLWALGCVVFETTACHPPFMAANQLALCRKIVADPTPSIAGCYSPQLHALVASLLEKRPENRPTIQHVLGAGVVQDRIRARWLAAAAPDRGGAGNPAGHLAAALREQTELNAALQAHCHALPAQVKALQGRPGRRDASPPGAAGQTPRKPYDATRYQYGMPAGRRQSDVSSADVEVLQFKTPSLPAKAPQPARAATTLSSSSWAAAMAPRALALDPEASPPEAEPEPEPSPATTPTASLQTRGPHAVQEHYQLGQKLRHKIGKARRPPGDDDDLNPFILEISERFGRSRIDADSLQDSAEDLQRQVQMALLQANSPPRGERPLSRRIAF